jgi:acetoin utilization deacetylase AcuC-like enzyme
MTGALRGTGDELGAPVAAVLEGGYSLQALGGCVVAATRALAGGPDAARPDAATAPPERDGPEAAEPLVARAREHLSRWWPALG